HEDSPADSTATNRRDRTHLEHHGGNGSLRGREPSLRPDRHRDGLGPITLGANARSRPTDAVYDTGASARPSVNVEIKVRDAGTRVMEFSFAVDHDSMPTGPSGVPRRDREPRWRRCRPSPSQLRPTSYRSPR